LLLDRVGVAFVERHLSLLILFIIYDYIFFSKVNVASSALVVMFSFSYVLLMPALLSVDNWVSLKPVLEAWGMLHLFIISYVQTQSNRVCNFHGILLWFMLPRNHFISRFFKKKQTGIIRVKIYVVVCYSYYVQL
jgi:hypothetical protein